jgi:hypothetical protein
VLERGNRTSLISKRIAGFWPGTLNCCHSRLSRWCQLYNIRGRPTREADRQPP